FVLPNFVIGKQPTEEGSFLQNLAETFSDKTVQAHKLNIINDFKKNKIGKFLVVQIVSSLDNIKNMVNWESLVAHTRPVVINDEIINATQVQSAISAAKQAIMNGEGVFIHSKWGNTYAAFMGALILAGVYDLSFDEALDLIRFSRPT